MFVHCLKKKSVKEREGGSHTQSFSTSKAEATWLGSKFQSSLDSVALSQKQNNNETDKNTESPKGGPQLAGQFVS